MTEETIYGMNMQTCKTAGSEFYFYPYECI